MKYTTYEVRSRTDYFPPFSIQDDGLGYLDYNIYKKIPELRFGAIGRIVGLPWEYDTSDIMVRRQGTKRWKKIKYRRGSSVYYLA